MFSRKNLALLLSFMILGIFFQSCNMIGGGKGNTVIQGSFPKFAGKSIVLNKIGIRETTPLDTATIAGDGDFRFRVQKDSVEMYLLKIDNKNYVTLVLDQERKVAVYSESDNIRTDYRVEGSEQSENLAEFEEELEKNKDIVDSLIQVINKGKATGMITNRVQMDEEYQDAFEAQKEASRKYIDENCGSLTSLLVLNRRFGQLKILTMEDDGDYYLKVDSCLSAKYPSNMHVLENKKRVETVLQQKALQEHLERKLAVGKKAPDITMENPNGKSISLYSLEGHEVIVYFWASWDKASRQTNKEMKRIYDMYRNQGLKVYAIGLETYRETWTAAIKADDLNWINVTDYLNIQSGSLSIFNVPKDLPYFYFLDKDLVIRYKGSSIPELLKMLKEG